MGRPADQQLVQDHAQGVDVAARVEIIVLQVGLLGAHVLGRSDQPAELGEHAPLETTLRRRARDAEIDHLGLWPVGSIDDQDVRRLQVAVQDPSPVRVLDGLAQPLEYLEPFARRQALTVAVLRDRHAVDVLHDEVRRAVLCGPGVERAGDAGVVHAGEHAAFLFEPLEDAFGIETVLDTLQRRVASERADLHREVDDAHTALAQSADRSPVSDLLWNRRFRIARAGCAVGVHGGQCALRLAQAESQQARRAQVVRLAGIGRAASRTVLSGFAHREPVAGPFAKPTISDASRS